VAKRSPILGYNHNVRYRGLVFHVQTEDSGVLSPHLFTHLFYEGVIVSTRKLVYDAGSAEDAIKALMQAQHKRVLKELKKGGFDDKIDEYLGQTPGLEPRGVAAAEEGDRPELTPVPPAPPTPEPPPPQVPAPPIVAALPPEPAPPLPSEIQDDLSAPMIELIPPMSNPGVEVNPPPSTFGPEIPLPPRTGTVASAAPPPAVQIKRPNAPMDHAVPEKPRTVTADRKSPAPARANLAPTPPPPPEDDAQTVLDTAGAVAASIAMHNAATIPTRVPTPERVAPPRSATPVPMPARSATPQAERKTLARAATPPPIPERAKKAPTKQTLDGSSEISITFRDKDPHERTRQPHDTAVEAPVDPAVPSAIVDDMRTTSESPRSVSGDSIPPLPPTPDQIARSRTNSERPASHGAATLPPVAHRVQRPPSRPAVTPPTVMTRPVPTEDGRPRRESEVIEVYAPAPASVEPPPGERAERPGQYIVSRTKDRAKHPSDVPMRDVSIPAGLGRPRKDPSGPVRTIPAPAAQGDGSQPIPKMLINESGSDPDLTQRTPPPVHRPPTTPQVASRTGSPGSAGVITTRPAVIVGAPAKPPATPAAARVRKAREEEGRGFGQGLISEKSLDEVILAYLSEDSEDK
jgi:hypothetical protein